MKVFSHIENWQKIRKTLNGSLGFVPTMGALHDGHLSLALRSRSENDRTIFSIFVNPTQFDNPQDLQNYPQSLEQDLSKLKSAGVDFVLTPHFNDLYADNYQFQVQERQLSQLLCGAHRPGHFSGVLTVVLKLLNIAQAHKAYFGEKDYQQYLLISQMVRAFFLPTEIVPCSIVRDTDGLALSSRNLRLSPSERAMAPKLFETIQSAASAEDAKKKLEGLGFKVDYIEDLFHRRFAAASLGQTRLIDNVPL
ncbi:MAG: pantoate--beta-alanine ligase [Pseudobdellovibrionaceae bacterium]|nr:pantoate--beta-alanine ligase [Bdellovibrionales bacterium]USN47134.1 MAG: pantoate--beta-alanine ligase [Pseudobdellovibrionaceae bacterium]